MGHGPPHAVGAAEGCGGGHQAHPIPTGAITTQILQPDVAPAPWPSPERQWDGDGETEARRGRDEGVSGCSRGSVGWPGPPQGAQCGAERVPPVSPVSECPTGFVVLVTGTLLSPGSSSRLRGHLGAGDCHREAREPRVVRGCCGTPVTHTPPPWVPVRGAGGTGSPRGAGVAWRPSMARRWVVLGELGSSTGTSTLHPSSTHDPKWIPNTI